MPRSRRPSSRSSPQDAETVTVFSENIELAGCELRWNEGKGDPFALIEAVAICAGRKWPYPKWVRRQFDKAYKSIFLSVFPGVDLSKPLPGAWGYSDAQSTDEKAVAARFRKAVAEAIKLLCLSIDRQHVLQVHKREMRDQYLANLVAELAAYKHTPRPRFVGVKQIIERLANALDMTPKRWARMDAENAVLLNLKGIPVRIPSVPAQCRMATVDQIRRAWHRHRTELLEERKEDYEEERLAAIEEMRGAS
jgi:hypothetical protein